MIKTIVRSALVIALVGTVLGLAQTARAEEKKADKTKYTEFKGAITVVDVKAGTVTIEHKKDTKTFTVTPDTKFGSGTESVNLNITNLKVGDHVVVHYADEAGKLVAHKIGHVDVSAPKAAKDAKQ